MIYGYSKIIKDNKQFEKFVSSIYLLDDILKGLPIRFFDFNAEQIFVISSAGKIITPFYMIDSEPFLEKNYDKIIADWEANFKDKDMLLGIRDGVWNFIYNYSDRKKLTYVSRVPEKYLYVVGITALDTIVKIFTKQGLENLAYALDDLDNLISVPQEYNTEFVIDLWSEIHKRPIPEYEKNKLDAIYPSTIPVELKPNQFNIIKDVLKVKQPLLLSKPKIKFSDLVDKFIILPRNSEITEIELDQDLRDFGIYKAIVQNGLLIIYTNMSSIMPSDVYAAFGFKDFSLITPLDMQGEY